jgi:hypothetical protein
MRLLWQFKAVDLPQVMYCWCLTMMVSYTCLLRYFAACGGHAASAAQVGVSFPAHVDHIKDDTLQVPLRLPDHDIGVEVMKSRP